MCVWWPGVRDLQRTAALKLRSSKHREASGGSSESQSKAPTARLCAGVWPWPCRMCVCIATQPEMVVEHMPAHATHTSGAAPPGRAGPKSLRGRVKVWCVCASRARARRRRACRALCLCLSSASLPLEASGPLATGAWGAGAARALRVCVTRVCGQSPRVKNLRSLEFRRDSLCLLTPPRAAGHCGHVHAKTCVTEV